ncbi:MAG: hypothetical protein RR161_01450 [Bacilli bacterium]
MFGKRKEMVKKRNMFGLISLGIFTCLIFIICNIIGEYSFKVFKYAIIWSSLLYPLMFVLINDYAKLFSKEKTIILILGTAIIQFIIAWSIPKGLFPNSNMIMFSVLAFIGSQFINLYITCDEESNILVFFRLVVSNLIDVFIFSSLIVLVTKDIKISTITIIITLIIKIIMSFIYHYIYNIDFKDLKKKFKKLK